MNVFRALVLCRASLAGKQLPCEYLVNRPQSLPAPFSGEYVSLRTAGYRGISGTLTNLPDQAGRKKGDVWHTQSRHTQSRLMKGHVIPRQR